MKKKKKAQNLLSKNKRKKGGIEELAASIAAIVAMLLRAAACPLEVIKIIIYTLKSHTRTHACELHKNSLQLLPELKKRY